MSAPMLTLAATNDAFMVVLFGGGMVVVVVAIVTETVQKVLKTRAKEQSRREIAAYVAEGSMTAEDGARLIAAGDSLKDKMGIKT